MINDTPLVIDVKALTIHLGNTDVLKNIDFSVRQGEIMAIVGGSGSGKSTLLRSILLLLEPKTGAVTLFGKHIGECDSATEIALRRKWGVMFQHGALFSALTVLENVMFPLQTYACLDAAVMQQVALLKLALVGLPLDAADKYPDELSGGMQKRVAIARALALDPVLLFLDEPTAGLDPQSADGLDELLLSLKQSLQLTLVLVTHDMDTLWRVADRVCFLGEGRVLGVGTMAELSAMPHPLIHAYFNNVRAKAAKERHG